MVVCDGFVGNIVLKTSESVAHAIGHWMKQEFTRNPVRMLGAVLLSGRAADHEAAAWIRRCTAARRCWA